MNKIFIYIFSAILLFTGCITNDIPYPVVVPHITSFDVQDAVKVDIDQDNQVITVHFAETTDIRNIQVRSVGIDEQEASLVKNIVGYHDFTSPFKFTIRTYSDYEWTVKSVREVERYFTVQGQIGTSVIDVANCRAIATVGTKTPIDKIEVTSLKLGPEGLTEYSLDLSEMKDFTHGITLEVTSFGLTEVWNLYIEQTDASVEISKVNPWTTEAYITSLGVAGMENGFMYREKGEQEWINVSEADITADGGSFTAHIKGLQPETAYEVYAVCGSDKTAVKEFVTAPDTAIPNGSFEYASKVAGENYYKFYDPACGVPDGAFMFWGSGNGEGTEGVNGSANMGIVITYIDQLDKVDGKQSVRAQTSQMAGILAAGNLFTGQFAGLVGTSGGKVNFGRPWTERPKAIKLYCKYTTGKMDIVGKNTPPGVTLIKGETYDRADIKVAFGYWDYKKYRGTKNSPVHVDTTNPSTFVDYNTDNSTIGNGNLTIYHDGYSLNGAQMTTAVTDQWVEYTIPINYRDIETLPTHIIISCAASQYGDYFSGCSTSKLWIDKVEAIY
jgi:hypothetical protein